MERPTDEALRKAQTTLRGLVSDGPSHLPSLNLVADSIRLELEKSGQVALLYVSLARYGRLEPVFGWRIVSEILDAVAANLESMVGNTLRRLDVVSDFTLTDDAFIVLLSPPRSAAVIAEDDLAAVTRRVYERLQSLLLNDLAPGVYDRVHPSVGSAVLAADASLTFEQTLQHGLALAMQAAEEQAALYDQDLQATLADCVSRGDLEPLFEPVVDPAEGEVIGYRSSVRGPFYSPLRLPDVLLDIARRSEVLASYGIVAREATVSAASGLEPDDLLFLGCAAGELPNAAVVAVSEFYSLNPALVPQHVVFDIDAGDLRHGTASTLRTLADVRDLGFLLCISGLGAQFTALELIAEAGPDFLCLDPVLVAGL
ncbi:MAG: EAL domain-containing protein, partial [Deltaproteobacteria bacterium]